jgi:hypothetical protein
MRPRAIATRGALAFAATATLAACAEDSTAPLTAPDRPTPSLAVTAAPISTQPELPRTILNVTYVAPTGKTIRVNAGGDLQAAINAAVPGDVVVLQAGATFYTKGGYYLPKKSGTGFVTIRTSTSDAYLPVGKRVSPADAPKMAKIVSTTSYGPALRTGNYGADRYRIIGLELTVSTAVTWSYGIMQIGNGHQDALSEIPSWIILDRVYIHGHSGLNLKRCVGLNGASSAIIESYLDRCHGKSQDSQAISGWTGPGPYKITNNYLAGAGEVVMFGGADPNFTNMVPSDIEFRRNHVTRPTSWKGVWTIKNLIEFKNARRVLIEGNVIENNWSAGQSGIALVWKSVNQNGGCTWCVVSDITMRYNKVRRTAGVLNLASSQGTYPAVKASRISLTHNVFDQLDTLEFTGLDRTFQLIGSLTDITINHNTIAHYPHYLTYFVGGKITRFDFRNNLGQAGSYGVKGDGSASGSPSLGYFTYSYAFVRNAVVRNMGWTYPTENYYPSSFSAFGFVNLAGGNYRLASTSPLKGKASDGTDPGANIDLVEKYTAGVVR